MEGNCPCKNLGHIGIKTLASRTTVCPFGGQGGPEGKGDRQG